MNKGLNFRSEPGCSGWTVLGWVLMVVVGVGLAWFGFTWSPDEAQQVAVQPSATAPATALPSPTPVPTLPPTEPPPPTFTPEPTAVPPTETPAVPNLVAGADGVNVRSGPGTNFTRLGYLDPGAQALVIGRYGDWWQIEYDGAPSWVFGEIVTPSNTDGVPQVQPPPSPTSVPPTETPIPTATFTPEPPPGPPPEFRGLEPLDYWVEDAPGPFDAGSEIWFNMDIKNTNAYRVEYEALGTLVQENGQFQKSWTKQKFGDRQHFTWRDHLHIKSAGTYNLWMRICFTDGACANLMGPVTINVR
jgi:uncharacterized protein YraI